MKVLHEAGGMCELSTVVHFLGWMQAAVAADIIQFQPPLKSDLGINIKTLAIHEKFIRGFKLGVSCVCQLAHI